MADREKPWFESASSIRGFLCDISGVLYNEKVGAVQGSVEAITRLLSANVPIRFLTNETSISRELLVKKLHKVGYEMKAKDIFAPIPAVVQVMKERHLRPFLLIREDARPDFEGVDTTNPNCVVLGDADNEFTYERLNTAFRLLMSLENPVLISMGKGRYYKSGESLSLDVGAYMKLMEYAVGIEAEIVGKPSNTFFLNAIKDLGLPVENVVMIGDDIVSDIGGAQACGIRGLQVRTGKFRPCDEPHPTVKPDGYVDNLAEAVDLYLKHR